MVYEPLSKRKYTMNEIHNPNYHYLRGKQIATCFDNNGIIGLNKGVTKDLAYLLQEAQTPFQQNARRHSELTKQVLRLIEQLDQKALGVFDKAVSKIEESLSKSHDSKEVAMQEAVKKSVPNLRSMPRPTPRPILGSTLEKICSILEQNAPIQDFSQQSYVEPMKHIVMNKNTEKSPADTNRYLQNANIIYEAERELEESGIIAFSGFDYYPAIELKRNKIERLRKLVEYACKDKTLDKALTEQFMFSINKLALKSQMRWLALLACQLAVAPPSNALTAITRSRFASNNRPSKVYVAELIVKLAKKMHRSSDRKAADQLLRYINVPTVGYTNSSVCEDDSNTTNTCVEMIKGCNPINMKWGAIIITVGIVFVIVVFILLGGFIGYTIGKVVADPLGVEVDNMCTSLKEAADKLNALQKTICSLGNRS